MTEIDSTGDKADTTALLELLGNRGQASEIDDLYQLINTISNINSSYDDPFDAFPELVQNACDAVEERFDNDPDDYTPTITVLINVPNRRLEVVDNGTGIAWGDRRAAVKPNYSLKRRLGQKSSRGEKGAALTFLQFGHHDFGLQTATENEAWVYTLSGGKDWFQTTSALLESSGDSLDMTAVPKADHELKQISLTENTPQGTRASVIFEDDRLLALLTAVEADALKRLEYVLRTRTGIGFFVPGGDRTKLAPWQASLQVNVELVLPEGTTVRDSLETGFYFPHEQAAAAGARKTGLITGKSKSNELLYEFFDIDWIKKYLDKGVGKDQRHLEMLAKYAVTGYVSYSHQNNWYEEVSAKLLHLPENADASDQSMNLVQVNGGFLVAVKDFPTGRRKSFLHRSGAEHKSRTFVLLNFSGDYKPDYGRKNLSADVHPLVLELCKELISFASARRELLYRGTGQSTHSAKNRAEAEEALKADADRLKSNGILINSNDAGLKRAPASEVEVVAELLRLVALGHLPGFSIYGFLARGMLDGYFDYALPVDLSFTFASATKALGVSFAEGKPISYTGQWMEFKVKSDSLVDDFKKNAGVPGKKYFALVNLLVCESVDDATDDYELIEVTEDNFDERKFFGVTHLLRSTHDSEHAVQVISLRHLRSHLVDEGADVDLPNANALEE